MSNYRYDVFLSHNSQDKPAVRWLAAKLADEADLRVFLDIWNLIPGDPWQGDLERALDASRTVAVFLGPAGISGWHNEELRDAINTRVRDPQRRVIPVLLPGTSMPEEDEIPNFLGRLTWVDFRPGLEDEEAFRLLVAGIRGQAPGRGGEVEASLPPAPPAEAPPTGASREGAPKPQVDTGGGAYVGGNVDTGGGDFVGRDKTGDVSVGDISVGGDVKGGNIIIGHNNVVTSLSGLRGEYLQQVFEAIEAREGTSRYEKEDLKAKVESLRAEDEKGAGVDEGLIAYQLETIKKMAPDILEVALATIANPLAGFGLAARKVAERMRAESGG